VLKNKVNLPIKNSFLGKTILQKSRWQKDSKTNKNMN
jgi:hypothetical protein